MIFDPYDCTKQEARRATMSQPAPLIGRVVSREIRDCFKVSRFGK